MGPRLMVKRFLGCAGTVGLLLVAATAYATPDDHENLAQLQRQVDEMVAASAASSVRSHVASAILLFGLVVEVIGALFLSGPALTAKQEEVMSLRPTSGWQDLAMHDVSADRRMNFLGALGAAFLVLGFVIQFGGTLLTLGIRAMWCVPMILIAIGVAGYVLYFLLGQSPGQSRIEKLSILLRNFRRLITGDRGCRCDCCNKRVNDKTGEVRWREQAPAEKYPYLYTPREWHVGHPACLDAAGWYEPIRGVDGKEADTIRRASFAEFLLQRPEREKWWEGWRTDAASKPSARNRTRDDLINPAEHEYRAGAEEGSARFQGNGLDRSATKRGGCLRSEVETWSPRLCKHGRWKPATRVLEAGGHLKHLRQLAVRVLNRRNRSPQVWTSHLAKTSG